MAKAKSSAAQKEEHPESFVLPLPGKVVRHHLTTLARSMQQWQEQRRVPPVLLLTGPSGVGKREIGYYLGQWLLCARTGFRSSAPQDDSQEDMGFGASLFGDSPAPAPQAPPASGSLEPCGECPACVRALKNNWVDFTEISADVEEGQTGNLKIEQFRKLKSTVGFGAFDGAFRITLIRDADRMTVQAANSLLKLLEEPPPGWIFFLTASDPTLILPTIISRCQSLRLRPFQSDDLRTLLQDEGVAADRSAVCAELAQGSWKKAVTLSGSDAWDKRGAIFGFLEEPHAELNGLVDWAAQDSSNLELLMNQLEQLTAELVHWSMTSQSPSAMDWKNQDGKRSLASHAQRACKKLGSVEAARDFWMERAERLFQARQEALAPLNRKLLIQDLLIPWLSV